MVRGELREVEFAFFDLGHDLLICVCVERRIPTDHNISHHANTPYITLMVILLLQHLRSNIVGRPKSLLHFFRRIKHPRSSKINDFNRGVLVLGLVENVLRLEITVHDVLVVAIADSA